jgi:thiol-disulfide isomerase/thioredoxin
MFTAKTQRKNVRMVLTWIAALASWSTNALGVTTGEKLEKFSVQHIESGELDAKAFQGKVTLINFWATWCEACKVEIREMEDQLKPLAAETRVQVAFVSLDKDPAQAREWFRSQLKEPDFWLKRLYVDPEFAMADALKVDAFPMTLVVGPQGEILQVQKGFKPGEGSTEALTGLVKKTAAGLRG